VADHTGALQTMASSGTLFRRSYIEQKLKLVTARETASRSAMEQSRRAIDALLPIAAQHRVQLAIETAARYEDAPTESELDLLLAEYPSLGVWYDFGAIQRKANLGFLNHEAYLRHIAPRVVGADVHDVEWPVSDHELPGTCDHGMGIDTLLPLLPAAAPRALELRGSVRRSYVHSLRQRWLPREQDALLQG
jgi:sugar phosphate isomerase/epimerase